MNLDIQLETHRTAEWNGKHDPRVTITFDQDGNIGIWVSDGHDVPRTVCWCDLPPYVIRTLAAIVKLWPIQPEES